MSTLLDKTHRSFDAWFHISERGSSIRQEIIAGLTIFLSMVYSVIVVPGMLSKAGFLPAEVFVSTCLVSSFGSIIMGLLANLPMAIGCAISLAAFTAFNLILEQKISIQITLGAVFLMGILFTLISASGIRAWILRNMPMSIAHGTGMGIGIFLILIAADSIGLVVKNPTPGLPITLGNFTSFPVTLALLGLSAIFGLEKRRVPGGILFTIIAISLVGLEFDPELRFKGLFSMPSLRNDNGCSLFFSMDITSALQAAVLPGVLALSMTAIFDATATMHAVTGQQNNLLDKEGHIINGSKALIIDSVSSIFAGLIGSSPAAVYIESAAGIAAGGKTGLTAIVVGLLFLLTLFMSPLAYLIPSYATAPALMYVGLLMLSNAVKIDISDFIEVMSGLMTMAFIVLTCSIVTGIMFGFSSLVMGRIFSGEWEKLSIGTVIIAVILLVFYASGWSL